jgi:hypothetical protein
MTTAMDDDCGGAEAADMPGAARIENRKDTRTKARILEDPGLRFQ